MNDVFNTDDPMDEIYAIRQKISAKYGHDVRRLAAAARERMERDIAAGTRKYVRLPIARRTPAVV